MPASLQSVLALGHHPYQLGGFSPWPLSFSAIVYLYILFTPLRYLRQGLMVTAVTAPSSNDSRSSNVSVPVPATSVRNPAALVSTMGSSSPGVLAPNITISSESTFGASSLSAMAQAPSTPSSASTQTAVGTGSAFEVSTTSHTAPSTTGSGQSKPAGSPPSTGIQQPSPTPTPIPTPTPPPPQNGPGSGQPSISTIHSTTVITQVPTATSTSTSTLSTFTKPVAVTQVAQNGSTSVFTPSFVTVLTTSTNSDGSAVTWTGVYANPTGDSSSQQNTFFQNTGAVAGVFTVLGIVVALAILCAVYLIRRSRRKRRQSGWQSPAESSGRYDSQTMRSVSSETSEVSRSRMALPQQDYSRGYLPVHVDVVQETEHYPPAQGPSIEAPIQRPTMVSLTHNRLSSYSPSVPVSSEPVQQEPRRWPPAGPFTDASTKRFSLMRDNGPNYLPKIPVPLEVGQVLSRERRGEVSVSPSKMAFPTRDNATSKKPSILVPAETTEVRNVDPRKWKVRLATTLPSTQQRGNGKPVEGTSSSSQSSPSIYPSSLPPIESEDESTTVGEQSAEPTVEVKKQTVTIIRPHSAGAPPRPPRSVLRSLSFRGPQSYNTLDSSTPSPSSSTMADSPQAILPRRTLLDVRPRSAPQGTSARSVSMYQ